MDKFSLLYPQIVTTKVSINFYHKKKKKKKKEAKGKRREKS